MEIYCGENWDEKNENWAEKCRMNISCSLLSRLIDTKFSSNFSPQKVIYLLKWSFKITKAPLKLPSCTHITHVVEGFLSILIFSNREIFSREKMEKKTNTKEDESERKRDSAHPTHANFPSRYDESFSMLESGSIGTKEREHDD